MATTDASSSLAAPQPSETKIKPNYLIALKIDKQEIKQGVEAVQNDIVQQDQDFKKYIYPSSILHVNLLSLELRSEELLAKAKAALNAFTDTIKGSLPITAKLSGIEGIRDGEVVVIKLQDGEALDNFARAIYDHFRTFEDGALADYMEYRYEPHVIIMKIPSSVLSKAHHAPRGQSEEFTAYLGNLPFGAREKDIKEFFKDFELGSVRLRKEQKGGHLVKAYGFVSFKNATDLHNAMKLNGKNLMGRTIRIAMAKTEEPAASAQPAEVKKIPASSYANHANKDFGEQRFEAVELVSMKEKDESGYFKCLARI